MRDEINQADLLVVKIGSALLLDGERLNRDWLAAMAADLAALKATGKKLVIVTSGAVSLGCANLRLNRNALGWLKHKPPPQAVKLLCCAVGKKHSACIILKPRKFC